MKEVTVTIGRQNGSGGREVGKILAEKMGLPCYDWEIVEETARKYGKTVDEIERTEERARTKSTIYFYGVPSANPVFAQQAEVIREFASRGPAVFVGRSADYVLSDRKDVVNVFVTAPMADRIKRSAARNGISEKDAYKRIREKDAGRADYYLRFTGRTWGDASNYHITLNSGPIGVEGVADMILDYISRMKSE
ncbi:MAG: cytidylate kinase-like family protein [Thermoplasmata archaeon]|nr:cytidylate kinase-like family protein [Thermoplasmata archaeon]